jgi:hypothetical protein
LEFYGECLDYRSKERRKQTQIFEIIVQDDVPKGHEVWTEIDELRVEFDK